MPEPSASRRPFHVLRSRPGRERDALVAGFDTAAEARACAAAENRALLARDGPPAASPFVFFYAAGSGHLPRLGRGPADVGLPEVPEAVALGKVGGDRRRKGKGARR